VKYTVVIKQTDEGFSAWVPGLPGCWSEGNTEQEAVDNVAEAIGDYLSVAAELASQETGTHSREIEIKVAYSAGCQPPSGDQSVGESYLPGYASG